MNELMQQAAFKANVTPAIIETNVDEVVKAIESELEKYRLVVTRETIKDAKGAMAELNKAKAEVARVRKEVVAQVTAPAQEFEQKMRGIEGSFDDTRAAVKGQVDKYVDQERTRIYDLMEKFLLEVWDDNKVAPEFRCAQIDDLVKGSASTTKGALTKAALEAVAARVAGDVAMQNQTHARLSQLEAASYRASLDAPLQREHVQGFLFDESDDYERQLNALIEREVQRQDDASERAAERIEREKAQSTDAAPAAQPEPEAADRTVATAPEPEPTPAPAPAADGKTTWQFTVVFQARSADKNVDALRARIIERFSKIGLNAIESVNIEAAR